MTAVYIGAGLDFKYIDYININTIICIDGQPFSEFGKDTFYKKILCCFKTNINLFSRPTFIPNLIYIAKKYGYIYIKNDNDRYIFKKNDKTVIYYVNTSIPEDLNKVYNDIKDFDNLIVMGHDPNSDILKATSKKINFWGNKLTSYKKDLYYDKFAKDNEEDNNVGYNLNYIYNFYSKFKSFNLVNCNGKISKYKTWNVFKKNI